MGGPERKVADIQPRFTFFRQTLLEWCPDSTCLLVSDSAGPDKSDAIFAISLDRGEKRQLTYPPSLQIDSDPDISPDGRSLIFRRDVNPLRGQFHRVSLKGGQPVPDGEPVRLTSALNAGKAVWLPNGHEVLFASRGALWRFDALRAPNPHGSLSSARTVSRRWCRERSTASGDSCICGAFQTQTFGVSVRPPPEPRHVASDRRDGIYSERQSSQPLAGRSSNGVLVESIGRARIIGSPIRMGRTCRS